MQFYRNNSASHCTQQDEFVFLPPFSVVLNSPPTPVTRKSASHRYGKQFQALAELGFIATTPACTGRSALWGSAGPQDMCRNTAHGLRPILARGSSAPVASPGQRALPAWTPTRAASRPGPTTAVSTAASTMGAPPPRPQARSDFISPLTLDQEGVPALHGPPDTGALSALPRDPHRPGGCRHGPAPRLRPWTTLRNPAAPVPRPRRGEP
jgi:hypothetical protein